MTTGFDELAVCFEATAVLIAAIGEWLCPARAVAHACHADHDKVERREGRNR
jgi:hypothetical protein